MRVFHTELLQTKQLPAASVSGTVISMSKSERRPVDKYSKSTYEAGLSQLSEVENSIEEYPLQEELKLHKKLREESPSPYPLREDEKRVKTALEAETAGFRKEVEQIKQDLWRQLGNAQTEATKMNDEMKIEELALVVLPQIIKIEDITHHKMEDSKNLSPRAQYFGKVVLEEAEATKQKIVSKKPVPTPTAIQTSFQVVQELHRQFVDMAGNVLAQDRYGHTTGGAVA